MDMGTSAPGTQKTGVMTPEAPASTGNGATGANQNSTTGTSP
jgi:hypothetical protein